MPARILDGAPMVRVGIPDQIAEPLVDLAPRGLLVLPEPEHGESPALVAGTDQIGRAHV